MDLCGSSWTSVVVHVLVWYVMYLCDSSWTSVVVHGLVWYVMYLCGSGIDFASFYDISIRIWSCSDSVLFF